MTNIKVDSIRKEDALRIQELYPFSITIYERKELGVVDLYIGDEDRLGLQYDTINKIAKFYVINLDGSIGYTVSVRLEHFAQIEIK